MLSDDELALLDDISDDWYGLWEIDWYFNGAHPDWSASSRIALMSKLVEQGLVEVFYGRMGTEHSPLHLDLALVALTDAENWQPRESLEASVYHASTSVSGKEILGIPQAT